MLDSESEYLCLIKSIAKHGTAKKDRTGVGTFSSFGHKLMFDQTEGFPLLTTKTVNFSAVRAELLWFLSGSTNTRDLDSRIWDEWADTNGELGPIYGRQWRSWPCHDGGNRDQIAEVQRTLCEDPDSRRHIVSAWNVSELDAMNLPPCHLLFQFYSYAERAEHKGYADTPYRMHPSGHVRRLDLQVYQRSADLFLGVPFNIASYSLLLHMMAQTTGHIAGRLHWVGGDCHLYENHVEQAQKQMSRSPRNFPRLVLNRAVDDIDGFAPGDIEVDGYDPWPALPAQIAV